jgi:hypothetical protein
LIDRLKRSLITSRSACADAVVAPGFRRPIPNTVLPIRAVSGVSGNGVIRSISLPGAKIASKSKDFGSTPTIVSGSLLVVSARPTIVGSPAKRRCQNAWLRSATRGALKRHSSAVKLRPSSGVTPSRSRKLSDTPTLRRRSGSPAPVSVWRRPKSKKAK